MIERLVVHVGPAKTGSTTIQRMLARNSELLESAGVGYHVAPGAESHSALEQHLLSLDDGAEFTGDPAWRMEDRLTESDLAPVCPTEIVSGESLHRLGPRGRDELLHRFPCKTVSVIILVRSPDKWLWSLWQQYVQVAQWEDFPDFVAGIAERFRDISEILDVWSDCPQSVTISVLDVEGAEPLEFAFLATAAPELPAAVHRQVAGSVERANEALALGELLVTAAAGREVEQEWRFRSGGPTAVPLPAVRRTFLDLVSKSHPFAELGADLERSEALEALFTSEAADAVASYCERWAEGARDCARSSLPLTDESRELLSRAADRAMSSLDQARGGPIGLGWPVTGFEHQLPRTVAYWAMVRVIVASAVIRWRTWSLRDG